jgi:hypothetical protein
VACQIVIYSEGIRIIAQRVKKNLDQDGFRDKSRISRISGVGTGLTTGLNLNISEAVLLMSSNPPDL